MKRLYLLWESVITYLFRACDTEMSKSKLLDKGTKRW